MSIWDDPELMMVDEWVTFTNPGDAVTGEIVGIRKHTWPDGKVDPHLIIRTADGTDRSLTAGQVQLKRRLAELRPNIGDRIKIVFTEEERRAGGKTLKHFDVDTRPGDAPAPPAAPAPEPTPAPAPTAPADEWF